MIGCIGWGIMLAICIAMLCVVMPWWLVLLMIVGIFVYTFCFSKHAIFRFKSEPPNPMKNLERVKKEIEERKRMEAERGKQNAIGDTAAMLAGAALAHGMMHHKHKDISDIADDYRDIYDADIDDLYDLGIEDIRYDDTGYDSYVADYDEEQAAYDDFIASLDMDD